MKKQDLKNWKTWPLMKIPEARVAVRAALASGKMLKSNFSRDFVTYLKKDRSDFTPFDERAEEISGKIIHQLQPKAIIQSEDLAPDVLHEGTFWTIDGIDGTTNYSRRIPVCNHTLSWVVEGKVVLGVVYDFLHGELFYAMTGQGAFLNGKPIHIRERKFEESVITYAPLLYAKKGRLQDKYNYYVDALWKGMEAISKSSGRFGREFQSGGQELAWVACGRLDGYASSWTSPWDLSAGVLLVREAGGVATTIRNVEWQPCNEGVIAGAPQIHAKMIDHFRVAVK